MSERTEAPTPKRLRRAREEGDAGGSPFASQAVALVAAVALVPAAVVATAARAGDRLREAIGAASAFDVDAHFDAGRVAVDVITLSAPLLAGVAVASAIASVVQTGGLIAPRRLAPKLERVNPFDGVARLFSRARLFAAVRAMVGAGAVAWLVARALRAHAIDFARLAGRLEHVAIVSTSIARSIAWDAALVGLALAVVDVVVVRLEWTRRLRMTRDEVKREQRESEGDPRIKSARDRAYQEMQAGASIAGVRGASVVVAGRAVACALRYDVEKGDVAPVVIASGDGEMASRIAQAARAYSVPTVDDAELAAALAKLGIGDAIPEALYERVAEILGGETQRFVAARSDAASPARSTRA